MSSAMASSGVRGCLARCLRQRSKRNSRDGSRVGLNIAVLGKLLLCFLRGRACRQRLLRDLPALGEFALAEDRALRAQGLLREAGVAPMEDEVVMGVAQVFPRRDLEEIRLHRERVLAGSEA